MTGENIRSLNYYYTLGPDWQHQIVKSLGAQLIDNKLLIIPEDIASGGSIFLEVAPGLSVHLLDMTFHVPVAITRLPKDHNYYMIYYNIGDEISTHILGDTVHKVGYHSKLGMGFMDCGVKGVIMPPVGERTYSLRLLVDKTYYKSLAATNRTAEVTDLLFDESKNTLFFYSHIDSRSKVLLNELKREHHFSGSSFELKLKHIALYLLNYVVERTARFEPIINKLSQQDIDNILKTSQYMLDHLLSEFPGLPAMAEMAEMSGTKYKVLFKKILKESPNHFFSNEKLLLGQRLLQSGDFYNVKDIAYELGYNNPGYFTKLYKRTFGATPADVLVSKKMRDF
ncbi:AraC family transcriptional regulator [Pedobacter sp. HMWF019]|uniref:helix-turn-helix domain-containing protein n=1 Tax=Pedobacter sp. HMWF019 TaxID=2056856 RepID=UPI000D3A0ED9|nr:AraC family transcriptional regulator [Pedobacter sp. HMWF019]PTT02718.1 AraC family transcriptional regulator [Pedobacter sp. HMWF019]